MQSILTVGLVLVGGFFALMIGMNLLIRWRAKALEGKPLPEVPGSVGKALARAEQAMVYFFSPGCAACRAITPRMKALSESNDSVFVVDITQQLDVARALQILATPSTVEVRAGRVVAVHVGPVPDAVMERYGARA